MSIRKYKFTVGIPAFKVRYIEQAISSVLNQSFQDFEIIIINDCSPGNIDEIVNSYNDKRIKYYKNNINVGAENPVLNWNKCLENANSEFFVLLGDDDVLERNYLEEFNNLIRKYPTLDVFHCRSVIIDENSVPIQITPSWPEFENVYENIWHRINKYRIQFISDFVFRTCKLKALGGFYKLPLAWGSDDITTYIIGEEHGFAHTNKLIFKYRRNSHSISSSGSFEHKIRSVALYVKWVEEFVKKSTKNEIDEFYRLSIKSNLQNYYQKQRTNLIAEALRNYFWKGLTGMIINRKKFEIALIDILIGCLLYLKQKSKD